MQKDKEIGKKVEELEFMPEVLRKRTDEECPEWDDYIAHRAFILSDVMASVSEFMRLRGWYISHSEIRFGQKVHIDFGNSDPARKFQRVTFSIMANGDKKRWDRKVTVVKKGNKGLMAKECRLAA